MLNKIRGYEKSISRKGSDTETAITVFGSISRGLQNSGGYTNLCIADALNRLALERLSELAVNDPANSSRFKVILSGLDCVHFSAEHFTSMIYDEPAQHLKDGTNLLSLEESQAREKIFAAVKVNQADIMNRFLHNQAGTSILIENLQIGVLLERMAQTDAIAKVDLAGLLELFERGGKFSNLNPADIRSFNTIMNGSQSSFNSSVMNVKEVRVSNLVAFVKSVQKEGSSNIFTKIALQ